VKVVFKKKLAMKRITYKQTSHAQDTRGRGGQGVLVPNMSSLSIPSFPVVCGYLHPPCFCPIVPLSAVPLSTPRAVAHGSGGVVLLALVIVIPLVFVLPWIWSSWPCCHPCRSPVPPHKQLLTVVVGGAAVVMVMVHMVLQPATPQQGLMAVVGGGWGGYQSSSSTSQYLKDSDSK
jgi:hypothetical protein